MKIKEIPISLFYQNYLSLKSIKKLKSYRKQFPVIISLTSIPPRFNILHLTIRSILNQNVLPEKIILWLNENQKDNTPNSLKQLECNFFKIRFSNLDCPHLKLVESLRHYPNKIIITIDDDLMYRQNWLNYLYMEHLEHPKSIIANQTRIISFDQEGTLKPYEQWPTNYNAKIKTKLLLPIGSAGALYPPNSLNSNVLDDNLFLKLAPRADDLWFKAMSLLNNTDSLQSSRLTGAPIPIWGSQEIALKKSNIGQDKNRLQWQALTSYFNLKL